MSVSTLYNHIKRFQNRRKKEKQQKKEEKELLKEQELLEKEKLQRKIESDKQKDKDFFEYLPAAYNEHKNEPIDENKILFVERRYTELTNSFIVLYDYLIENYNFDIHVHYLDEIAAERQDYIENCRKMLIDMATAKCVFLTDANEAVSCVDKREETIVVQLWHGCGAFKKFGMSTADLIFGGDSNEQLRHPTYKNNNIITVSSPEVIWAYSEAMNIPESEGIIKPLGISRTDVFFDENFAQKARKKLYEKYPFTKDKKIILYAPTFRGRVKNAKSPTRLSLGLMHYVLSEEYVVLLNLHPLIQERPKIANHLSNFAADVTGEMTIDELIAISDICISDYSSMVFEYSLMNKPMIFFAFDIENYLDWRGFYYEYDELTPGPVLTDTEEVVDYIKDIDNLFDPDEVKRFREKFMSSCDGNSTKRILEEAFGVETLKKHQKKGE